MISWEDLCADEYEILHLVKCKIDEFVIELDAYFKRKNIDLIHTWRGDF